MGRRERAFDLHSTMFGFVRLTICLRLFGWPFWSDLAVVAGVSIDINDFTYSCFAAFFFSFFSFPATLFFNQSE